MTVEDLLQPRYKVIADYPNNPFRVGDILMPYIETKCIDFILYDNELLSAYPHLFRKLEWWEERAIEDMPEYVEDEDRNVYKVKSHFLNSEGESIKWCEVENKEMLYIFLKPATLAEYTNYLTTKQ